MVTIFVAVVGFAVIVVPRPPMLLLQGWLGVEILLDTSFLFLLGVWDLAMSYWLGRAAMNGIKDLLAGNHLVRWPFDPDEWRHFAEVEWARTKRAARILPLVFVFLFVLVGLVSSLLSPTMPIGEGLLFGGMIGAAVGPVNFGTVCLQGKEQYRRRLRTTGELYFGPSSLYTQGVYASWRLWGLRLSPVGMDPGDPTMLRFNIEIALLRRRGVIRQVRVPIPHGKEEEARELLKQLSGR